MSKECEKCKDKYVGLSAIEAVKKYKGQSGAVMMALHYIQDKDGYISYENQKYLSENIDVSMAEIYGIITFYNRFTLEPKGKYNVQVCIGTACYVKGSDTILDTLKEELGIEPGQMSEDKLFSIEAVRCLGACGLAPVMVINKEVYGNLTKDKVKEIINKLKK